MDGSMLLKTMLFRGMDERLADQREDFYNMLLKTMLFRGMDEAELGAALEGLQAAEKAYAKGEFILRAGSPTQRLGLVLEGGATVESNDAWGSRTVLSHIGPGQLFAETYALLEGEPMLVDVTASANCRILFLRTGSLQELTAARSAWAAKLAANLLSICAHKNLALSRRSFHTAPKSARGRIMAYLSTISLQKGAGEFDIPFDRQQLADYLNLERTALSKELGKMQRDGLIEVKKSRFRLFFAPE